MNTQTAVELEALSVQEDWLEEFASHLEEKGKSERTVKAYCQDLRLFADWYTDRNGEPFSPEKITSYDLREYRKWVVNGRRMAPSTWNRRRNSLIVYCRWSKAFDYLSYDPFEEEIHSWQEDDLPPRWLDRSEFSRFMRQVELMVSGATTDHWKWQALRDQAMVALMMFAGLREGELVALDVENLEMGPRSGKVTIWSGKGEKKREIPLNAEARRALTAWLDAHRSVGPLFIGKTGQRLSTRSVQRRVAEIGRRAGIEITPHDLRHTFAKRALDNGAPLTVVSKLLGHSRLETTARYVQPGWGDYQRAVEAI